MATARTQKQAETAYGAMHGVFAAGQEAVQSFAKASADGFGKAAENARSQADEFTKTYEDFATAGKDNVDAMVEAGTVYAKGMEAIASELIGFARAAMDQNIANAKTVMAAKNVHDVVDLNTSFAKSNFEEFVSQSTRLGDMATKVAQDAMQPINAQVNEAMDKLKRVS